VTYIKYLLFLLSVFVTIGISGQNSDRCILQGRVIDSLSGESLLGVNVYVESKRSGTVSDTAGFFSLQTSSEIQIFVFSCIGYKTKIIKINPCQSKPLIVLMQAQDLILDEIKITAQRKFFGNMEYGREIPSISGELIEKQTINNASDILHARIAGVWATRTSGAPGDHQKIRIRGQNSFFSSAEPLYVVDGVPVPIVNMSSLGIADLNIHDIDNVTVLRDASSTALYGFQGGNGVVLIDTKQGGAKAINFSVKTGIQWFNHFYDMLSAEEQINILDSAYSKMRFITHEFYPEISDLQCDRNWQDYIFSPGQLQEYQLSGSGRLDKLKYYLSGNYGKHQGIISQSEYERYTLAARLGTNLGKHLAIGLAYRGSYQKNLNNQDEYQGNRLIWEGISKSPCLECTPDSLFIDEFDRINLRALHYYLPAKKYELPQEIMANNQHRLNIQSHAVSGFGRIQLSDHLTIDVMESLMLRASDYNAEFDYYYFTFQGYSNQKRADMMSREDVILYNHQMNLSYYNTLGKHDLSFVLAHRYYKDNLWWNVDSLEGSLDRHFSLKNSMAAYGPEGSVLRNLTSYIGHASYNYGQKYFISAILNLSKVKEGIHTNYYSYFPSIALGWDLAREAFLNKVRWMNKLELFINWGISGNYPLNGLSNDLYVDVIMEHDGEAGLYPSVHQFSNHHLRHESTREADLGLKGSLLHDRIGFSATYYRKTIDDLILQRDIPLYYGGGKMFLNVAQLDIHGYEFTMEAVPLKTATANWLISFNYSSSKQQVTKLDQEESMLFADADILIPEFIVKEGRPVGDIYGYRFLGKWTDADDTEPSNTWINVQGSKFLNADTSDYVLDENDKVVLGNALPDFTWNLSSAFSYKNFGLDMVWYAAWGQEKYNATRAATVMTAVNREVVDYISDTLRILRADAFYESDVFVENAGFIRLKTISLHYTPGKKLWDHLQVSFSLSFENVLTFTKYTGYDPEATIFTDNNFSDNSIDRGAYPNAKAIYASINLKF
jgi:TonB-dependent starch-binding outer membrane protein SusC